MGWDTASHHFEPSELEKEPQKLINRSLNRDRCQSAIDGLQSTYLPTQPACISLMEMMGAVYASCKKLMRQAAFGTQML